MGSLPPGVQDGMRVFRVWSPAGRPGLHMVLGGQTWSHAGPAVALLFAPALSQACRKRPDAPTQSLFHSSLQHGSHYLTLALWHYFAKIIAASKWLCSDHGQRWFSADQRSERGSSYSLNNWRRHRSAFLFHMEGLPLI